MKLLLIDLSSILHPIYHATTTDPNPDATSRDTLTRVHALALNEPHVAICCDSRKSFRRELDPSYKAQRDTAGREPLYHQMAIVVDQLKADGFPVWEAAGFEADDLIASAVGRVQDEWPRLLAYDGVEIVTADKDLLCLVSDDRGVTVKSATTGHVMREAEVHARYQVFASQMTDFLCVAGDASDNWKGAKGIGEAYAAQLLFEFGTLDKVYAAIDAGATPRITPAKRTALVEFRPMLELGRKLVGLRTDAPIPFAEVFRDRAAVAEALPHIEHEPVDELRDVFPTESEGPTMNSGMTPSLAEAMAPLMALDDHMLGQVAKQQAAEPVREAISAGLAEQAAIGQITAPEPPPITYTPEPPKANGATTALAPKAEALETVEVLPPAARDFTMQLEPRSLREAMLMGQVLAKSRLYTKYGSSEGIFAAILRGRELGFPAGASVDAYHVLDGKLTMDATAIRALVLKSGKAKYFRIVERTDERATFETQRDDDPPVKLSYSVAEARKAWKKGKDEAERKEKFEASGWGANPADMCVARAGAKLARLVYPDVTLGLYAPEEMD